MISRTPTSRMANAALVSGLAVLLAAPLAAQGYKRTPGDTLRYHVVDEGKIDPKGAPSTESRREMTVAVLFGTGDNAQVWLESFTSLMKMQGREMQMPGGPLNRPVPATFGANGPAQTLTNITEGGRGGPMSVLGEILPRLPAQALAVGVEWADTVGGKRDLPDGSKTEMQYIEKYKVMADTTVAGAKALVIATKGDGMNKTTRTSDTGSMETRLRTTESGRILFSVEQGRVLSWERTVDTAQRMASRGGPAANETMGRVGNPNGLIRDRSNTGGEARGRTQTVIELVGATGLKAAPAK